MALLAPPSARTLPRRDRIAIWSGLVGVTALAWIYLIVMAADMGGMSDVAEMMRLRSWGARDFALMFLMWAVMMVGMMVPSAAAMVLLHAAVARKAAREGAAMAPSAVFVAGYIAVWTLFSAGATLAQWGLESAALLSPMMVSTSPWLGGVLLVAAGLYQLTPAKEACLRHCRSPARFIAEHWKPGRAGAFRMGLEHGAWCLGCCWLLMGLLFFGGVMNLLWIAGITLLVLAEKLLPSGRVAGRAIGVAMIVLGVFVVARGL